MNESGFVPHSVRLACQRTLNRNVEDDSEFLQFARTCISESQSAVLLSGGTPRAAGENRYSVAAWDPFATFQSKGHSCTVRTLQRTSRHTLHLQGNPLDIMDELFGSFTPDFPMATPPFSGGAIGYFAYELKNTIECLPQTAHDDLHLPDILLFWPRQILVHDRLLKHLHWLSLGLEGDAGSACDPFSPAKAEEPGRAIRVGALRSNFSHEEYLLAVRKVRHYIREGDAYQVNLSQRYQFPFEGDAFQLWTSLFDMNPAPFYAYIRGADHQVLSTSMERFLYQKGHYIETRPIKGTRKRGSSPEEDEALKADLLRDPKDDAELSMIVDLLRNDLGRVCTPRTIRVAEHKRLESYQNVHHLVSIVVGRLPKETTYGELLRATFPGGSITGCPKIRSMEIIDELEPNVRHVYTGSIGYLGFHGNLDLNIAIRTALVHRDTCYFSVGGGIVYDSREEDEYQETLHKGRTLFQLIARIGESIS